jgi:hypothetical protein
VHERQRHELGEPARFLLEIAGADDVPRDVRCFSTASALSPAAWTAFFTSSVDTRNLCAQFRSS